MHDLEAGVLRLGDDLADAGQLTVGEDVPVDERAGLRALVVRAGDAVVEQAALGAELVLEEAEVVRVLPHADVLGEPDRADRVEVALEHVAVVGVPHLGEVRQPLAVDGLLGPRRLRDREGDAERLHAVLARREADHAAPAAADVEQPHAGLEVELAGDEVVLVVLRLLERRVLAREHRAGVGHRRTQHHLVEAVRDVVVVVDRVGVATQRVAEALDGPAPARQRLLRRHRRRLEVRPAQPAHDLQRLGGCGRAELEVPVEQHQGVVRVPGVHALDVEVAHDVGPREAEVAGRGQQVGQPALVLQVHRDGHLAGADRAAVVRREQPGQVLLQQHAHRVRDPKGRFRGHCLRTALS